MSLFPASLLPPSSLSDLVLRPLHKDDHLLGHLDVLAVLSPTPPLSAEQYAAICESMTSRPETYYPIVVFAPSQHKIVATATLLVERKFLRAGGLVGHIEDVAVSSLAQGRGLGKVLVVTLAALAEKLGCYKCILDCSKENIPFYEKCGFYHKEYEMVQYFGAAKKPLPATPTPTSSAPAPEPSPSKAANL
ncbi:acyl-CoA N-acyltransferase [Calocera viscosa TUFC12733]|uniref:Glucosamine 6-phosphate N-acetyltransferase n=1 Tax=Calocera viscosa (strain TUFC12733) TaxID=1330018 RepID=A0A167KD64_CALVF|nr:acyl-CoA N-acyltransferase [Calocera viscosa TUFC12733]